MSAVRRILFPNERKKLMSRTIEAIMAHMVPPPKRQAAPVRIGTLIAEWQEGPPTISGYASRKLRLAFASRNSEAGISPGARHLSTLHFRLPTSSAFAQHALGATLGLSAKELI